MAILSALGITLGFDEGLWVGAIVAFAALSVCGLVIGFSCHRQVQPLMIGSLGAMAIGFTMYVQYLRLIELSGFALLCIAAVWDWSLRRVRQPGSQIAK